MKRRRINVIYADNGSGLSRDAIVMREALALAGHRVWLTPLAPRRFPRALNYAPELVRQGLRAAQQCVIRAWAKQANAWDINIFLERLVPDYFDYAPVNCLMPNEEWLSDGDRGLLGSIDMVLFKTRHAAQILEAEAKASAFVGFTSLDRRDPRVTSRWEAALHVCGWNPHKGTAAVARAWASHPQWPRITFVTQLQTVPRKPNIDHITRRIPDRQLRRLQNSCAVNVCPSEVEGFGHTVVEAMSCGSVVVTTEAPPMDELISPEEGFLVPHAETAPLRAGTRFLVDSERLSEVLTRIWTDGARTFQPRRRAARAKYDSLRRAFHRRLAGIVQEL